MPIPANYSTPVRISAKDRALSQIQRWIIDGTLQPGEKLNDAELAEALGVSRTPVREALQLLEVQGLVQMQPGRDTRVTTIEKEDILKMYSTLSALHALAAELAAPLILPEQIEMLKRLNAEFAQAIETGQPYQAMELDEQFHGMIIDAADNPYISSFSASLQIHIRRYKYVFLKRPFPSANASVLEHEALVAALEKGDGKSAADIMKQNIWRPMTELQQFISKEEG
ncbi:MULTISPECIES: GntR family transcriptional regulator [unclassified Paenibacillus]|uniref:GntR family transcriptional regulator n=1 Tax=unclassified Paenibacillus TaxID=185978 RepID=UPI001C10E1FF|nr:MULTISPECIES: GntR family transcriptional regulator [unclassified Paenibacillus]MBU5442842.1 GntR family transcriptional regulator [Paenibacillus sp. MSJ-34]CAH0119248.1 HTH-type transcriptional repressor RspR [Paenibacillus sp. CECT 9249]